MERNKITCVTSFGKNGLELYGSTMVSSFIKHWPNDVKLLVYLDDIKDAEALPKAPNVDYIALDHPGLVAFKSRNGDDPKKHGLPAFSQDDSGKFGKNNEGNWKFQYDAIRFCHKVFAMDMGARSGCDIALWIDGDSKTFNDVNRSVINSWLPQGKFAGFLDRPQSYTETGFHIFDMNHAIADVFFKQWLSYYELDSIFELPAWTDCHTYDAARRKFDQQYWFSLSPPATSGSPAAHVFINGPLGSYMDHMKGKRKLKGKSDRRDLYVQRSEQYWKD